MMAANGLALADASRSHQFALASEARGQDVIRWYAQVTERFCEFLWTTGAVPDDQEPALAVLAIDNARGFVGWLRDTPSKNTLTGHERLRSPKTVREYASALKTFAHFCVGEGYLEHDPLVRFKLPRAPQRVPVPYTQDEIRAMLAVIEQNPNAVRNRALFYLLLDTGGRNSEICQLKREDVDLHTGKALIMGKGAKERFIYFEPTTTRLLRDHLHGGPKRGPVFLTQEGAPFRNQNLYQLVRGWGAAADVDHPTVHRFRHTYALAEARANPGATFHLQKRLGHETLDMTRRYVQLAETEERLPGPSPIEQFGLARERRRPRKPASAGR